MIGGKTYTKILVGLESPRRSVKEDSWRGERVLGRELDESMIIPPCVLAFASEEVEVEVERMGFGSPHPAVGDGVLEQFLLFLLEPDCCEERGGLGHKYYRKE